MWLASDLATAGGVPAHTIVSWASDGVLKPVHDPGGAGRGRERLYDFNGLLAAAVAGTMCRNGLKRVAIRRVAHLIQTEDLRSHFKQGRRYVLCNGTITCATQDEVVRALSTEQSDPAAAFALDLKAYYDALVKRVQKELAKRRKKGAK